MARLVYSPRAYVFVKDQNGDIHNLTNYVTAGSVKRLIDQVSTAEITLRNPNSLFTVHVKDGHVIPPKFLPMDPITIYLRRVAKRPVRVFTGFLDRVPYLQLYPGTVTLQASCTLKRLVHTYFDPALPYTMSFLTTYGWVPYNGQWVSLTGMKEWLPPGTTPTDKNANMPAPNPVGKGSKNVYVIGDSLAVGTQTPLAKALPGYNIITSARVGRTTAQGIAVLTNYQKSGTLPETIVVSLGSNDDVTDTTSFRSRVKELMDLAGNKRHVIWFTLHGTNPTGSLSNLNPVLKSVKQDYANMTVVDWDATVAASDLTLDSTQQIHPNAAGYAKRAQLAADAVRTGALDGGSGNKLQPPKDVDGSLSQLLFATLKHIGSWDTKDIYIEAMPEDIFNRMTDLANEFIQDNKEARNEFTQLLKRIGGSGSHGSASGDPTSLGGEVKGMDKITQTIKSIADKYNIDAAMTMAVADIESGYGTNMFTHEPYHGWYQINVGGSRYSPPITIEQANDLQYSCTLFCKGAANTVPDSVKKSSPLAWAMYTQGVNGQNNPLYPQTWDAKYAKAKQLISQYGNGVFSGNVGDNSLSGTATGGTVDKTVRANDGTNKGNATSGGKWAFPLSAKATNLGGVAAHMSRPLGNWESDNAVDLGAPPGTDWIAVEDGVISKTLGWGNSAGSGIATVYGYRLHLEGASGNTYFYQHGASNIAAQGKRVSKGDKIGEIGDYRSNGIPSHLHFAAKPPTNPETVVKGENITGSGHDATSDASTGTSVTDNVVSQAAAGAFFASLDLPSMYDAVEASLLQGEKSLLNDKPLLPFIQQLCSASLRHFQSLPDGRFYGFYPDYFGEMEHHPPYWEIDDIEVLDGKIELTDDPLVTHSYVVGDTVAPMANSETPFAQRAIASSGVVTIFNAFMANGILDRTKSRVKDKQKAERLSKKHKQSDTQKKKRVDSTNPEGMGILLDRNEAANFLERYGARPVTEDMPMIKSPYFEMFLAYQKFLLAWSKQFSTPFSFTFMPELFPGGKVGFPRHGLQMYIESVEHSWDYESGFTTSASLTAPSAYGTNTGLLPPNMVQAIIEPATKASVG